MSLYFSKHLTIQFVVYSFVKTLSIVGLDQFFLIKALVTNRKKVYFGYQ